MFKINYLNFQIFLYRTGFFFYESFFAEHQENIIAKSLLSYGFFYNFLMI